MDARQSFNFSIESRKVAHEKKWAWLTKFLNKRNTNVFFDTSVVEKEFNPQPNWELPKVEREKIYKLPVFQFHATTLFRFSSVKVPVSVGQSVYQIPLIRKEDVEWGLSHDYKYIHIRLIQFGINPLVQPGLDNSCLTCVLDTRHNKFEDALIGGFQNPLNKGHVWSSVITRYMCLELRLMLPYIGGALGVLLKIFILSHPQSEVSCPTKSSCYDTKWRFQVGEPTKAIMYVLKGYIQ